MSLSSISQAAIDKDLVDRVTSAAFQLVNSDEQIASTNLGQSMLMGSTIVTPLMWPVAIATEAAYETALQSGRGAPGYDKDIITDAQIETAVQEGWPMIFPPAPTAPPV